jgi:hypothetical protein
MRRFAAIVVLATVGMVWYVYAGVIEQAALLHAFGTAIVLPLVLWPTMSWQKAFFVCFDLVFVTSAAGAALVAHSLHAPMLKVVTAGFGPALIFGAMASLGVSRFRDHA